MTGPGDDRDLLAAELALGVLDGEERAGAEALRASDSAFAREVQAWSVRLGRIAVDEASPSEAPARTWPAILRRVDEAASPALRRLRRSVRLWRGVAGASLATAAALAAALLFTSQARPPARSAAAEIQTANLVEPGKGATAFVAVLDPARKELVFTPVVLGAVGARTPQLWVLVHGKPSSLGLAALGRPVRLSVGDLVGAPARRTLAVSLEPAGGSPTGLPTGPVIASGDLRSL